MLAALKHIPLQIEYLGYGDVEAHHRLTPGKKSLPILQYDGGQCITESLDIVKHLDQLQEFGPPMLMSYSPANAALLPSVNPEHLFKRPFGKLVLPRLARCNLPELNTASDRQYFKEKKEAMIGDLNDNLHNTPQLSHELSTHTMGVLSELLPNTDNAKQPKLLFDDLLMWPMLRLLTVVKQLHIPSDVRTYISRWSSATGLRTFEHDAM